MIIKTKEDLIRYLNNGCSVEYLFFWGHTVKNNDSIVNKACLSQWYPASFTIDDIIYPTAEHYMMHQKALLFGDYENAYKIVKAESAHEAKLLGRQVKNFDATIWQKHSFDIVVIGNLAKFSQHQHLKEFLMSTQNAVLVEASPNDIIWGIGLSETHPDATNLIKWKGRNVLGFALMHVRDIILR